MKRSFFVLALVLPLICLSWTLSRAEKASGPVIGIPERAFNFKVADEGAVVEHAFKVVNLGNAPLEIKDVRPD